MLDYFQLTRGPEFDFAIRLVSSCCCFFFAHNYLTNCDQQRPTQTPLGAIGFVYPLTNKCPEFQRSQSQRLSVAGKTTPLLEHEANHSQLLRTVRRSPTCDSSNLNKNRNSHISVFFRSQNSHYRYTRGGQGTIVCIGGLLAYKAQRSNFGHQFWQQGPFTL